jgi:hypothetical protein
VQNIILEKKLDTFPSFVRILTEFDVILALKISTRDFEERHRNKTFLILRSLKNYVKTNFPSIVLSGKLGPMLVVLSDHLNSAISLFRS